MHSQRSVSMSSSPWQETDRVADRVLKRAEVSKIARRLQNRLALAQFKTKHGWEDLTLDKIEPKVEEERRRRRLIEGDMLSDSSSSTSAELPYPSRALMSSPMKPPGPLFSDAIGPGSSGSDGHRKRSYMAALDGPGLVEPSSPSKRYRSTSSSAHKSFPSGHATWKDMHQLAQSSPIKPRRQQHFTTQAGPNVSFLTSPGFHMHMQSDDEDDMLPLHSFNVGRSSPPRTPPMRPRALNRRRNKDNYIPEEAVAGQPKTGEEGADLLLYLAASPSPAVGSRRMMEPPSTPPPKNNLALPSSMMVTPGGSGLFPNTPGQNFSNTPGQGFLPTTPGQNFDFSEFVHINTPSPAQKAWKTPVALSGRTPLGVARRRLTFDEPLV